MGRIRCRHRSYCRYGWYSAAQLSSRRTREALPVCRGRHPRGGHDEEKHYVAGCSQRVRDGSARKSDDDITPKMTKKKLAN